MIIATLLVIALIIFFVWFASYQEAKSYNKYCTNQVTTWDAIFLDLRIDECVKTGESKMNMLRLFKVGDQLSGYCRGYFGSNGYHDRICVMVRPNYAVFEYKGDDGHDYATVLHYNDDLEEDVINWKNEGSLI